MLVRADLTAWNVIQLFWREEEEEEVGSYLDLLP